jgi:hypothetical protein
MPPKTLPVARAKGWNSALTIAGLLALMLGLLFYRSFIPQEVAFSNDGPLGGLVAEQNQLPQIFTGLWADLNSTGSGGGAATPSISSLLRTGIGPLGYAKFFPPVAIFILGLGAWSFFRALKLTPLAALLAALAAMLNGTFFGNACWGVAAHEIGIGMGFFALALALASTSETPRLVCWARLALAGLCVGVNVMEAADIGAMISLLVALFLFYKSFIESQGNPVVRIARSTGLVAIVAVFAGFIACQTVIGLVQSEIVGIAGTSQDAETKAQHWDWATQWSLPKKETLGIMVPGLFGYKMDTPKDMIPQFQDAYQGGIYWGGEGRDPALDRFLDAGSQGTPPAGFMRFTGDGRYCGILVVLIAVWSVTQSFRRRNSPFATEQKRLIWFWTAVLAVSLPLAWGRFAPMFYGLLYHLPYFSTIRNPNKFMFFFSWSLVVLFAYGIHALDRLYLNRAAAKSSGLVSQLTNWWVKADRFDRQWLWACLGLLGASALAWLVYAGQKPGLVQYLQNVGFSDMDPTHANSAPAIAAFSLAQAGWFLLLFATAIALVTLTSAGYFAGPRAKLGAVLLGAFLLFDLMRADLPYVIHWDYKLKYEVGSLNPVEDFLRNKPYEHRVAGLPFRAPEGLELLDELYRIEWTQHHFYYYNIQSLDIVQMPRMPANLKAYLEALSPRGTPESVPLFARHWALTNTRYLLGAAGYLDVLNQQLDPALHRFHIAKRFEIGPKPGILQAQQFEELTAIPNDNGRYALFEFTGALPRAKLYSNWQVNTNDADVLKTLADLNFDPAKTVLIDTPSKDLPSTAATNDNAGTVEFSSYAPKHIVFAATNNAPAVLLLNDQYDPGWSVTVDGRPAELMRCNYLMRGVYLPAGAHMVVFNFTLPHKLLYVTLSAMLLGILLGAYLLVAGRKPITSPSGDPKIPTAR